MRYIVALAVTALWSSSALAQSTKQREDAFNELARVIAFLSYCPRLTFTDTALVMLAGYNINLQDDFIRNLIGSKANDERIIIEGYGKENGCQSALKFYGPEGSRVQGMIQRIEWQDPDPVREAKESSLENPVRSVPALPRPAQRRHPAR